MKKEEKNKEKHTSDLIQTIGDIVIKSIFKHENATIQKGIDKLIEIAMEFLEMKSKNEHKFSVESESYLIKSELKNQYITYIANELDRIFESALEYRNSNLCRYIILNLSKILDKIMMNEKNWNILEQVIETQSFHGSLYYRLMEAAIRNNAKTEKMLLLQHLSSFPQVQLLNQCYKPEYLNQFINQHIFRMAKLIIDAGDFENFKEMINQFSTFIQLDDPGHLINEIEGELSLLTFHPDLIQVTEKLAFKIKTSCVKELDSIDQFVQELQNLKKEILSRDGSKNNEMLSSSFDHILSKIDEFQITFKIYSVFFVIGAYLVFKGKQYDQFMRELWYHTTPIDTNVNVSNRTPVSDDVNWLTLLITYRGTGSVFLHETIMFDNFQDANPFLYQYYALLLLKLGKVPNLPSDNELENWKTRGQDYKLDFFYDYARDLMPEKFMEALNRIVESPMLTAIRENNTSDKTSKMREQLNIFAQRITQLRNSIIQKKPILEEEITAYEKIILEAYENHSHCKSIANVKYDGTLSIENSKLLTSTLNIPREILIEKLSKPPMPSGPIASPLVNLELWYILSIINKSTIETVMESGNEYEKQIRNAVNHLIKNGYKPNVIFIPLKIKSALEFGQSTLFKEFGKNMKVDELELHTIYSWNQLLFYDIIIFDSKGLVVTYNKEKLEERIQFEVQGITEGLGEVSIQSKLLINIKMDDPKAFIKIVNEQYKE